MSGEAERYCRLPFESRRALSPVMKACSAYNERRAWFSAQPRSKISKGIWGDRKEAPEMMRLAEELVSSLLSDSGLCAVRTQQTDLGLAPRSALLNAMWGDLAISMVFYGGRLTTDRLDELVERIPNPEAAVFIVSIEPPEFPIADRLRSLRQEGKAIFLVTPSDVDALAAGKWSVIQMACYKIFATLLLGENDQQTIFDLETFETFLRQANRTQDTFSLTIEAAISAQELPPDRWLTHPIAPELISSVTGTPITFLLGTSASGKTTLALSTGRGRSEAGEKVFFIDVGAIRDDEILQIAAEILVVVQSKTQVLLILDDMQSNPRMAFNLLQWTRAIQSCGHTQHLRLLAVSWPEFLSLLPKIPPEADIHIIAASQVTPAIVDASRDSLNESQIDFAVTTSGNDLLVLHLVIEALKANHEDLSRSTLASLYWDKRCRSMCLTQDTAKRAMLVATTIGRYECEIPEEFLKSQSGVSSHDIAELCRCKLLRRSGHRLHAGHRSLCDLLALWLDLQVHDQDRLSSDELSGSEFLVLNYIRSLEPNEIWPILELIQSHAGFRASHELRESGRIMTDAWQSMAGIIDRINQQQKEDPTWGRIPSSAMFAVQALCAVGKRDVAKHSIAFIRTCYSLHSGEIQISTTDLGTNKDFIKIRERMIEEDEVTDLYVTSDIFEAGDEVDPQHFHETWFAGLTLCAEAFWSASDAELLLQLAQSIERHADPQGFFYPARVPWCTARVIMGLALCGRTVMNSPTVRKAVDWLLTPRSEGGVYNDGLWDSGTGTWNTTIESTAMCVTALLLTKVEPSHEKIQKSLSELLARRSEWVRAGREIDGAMSLLAFSMLRTDWRSVLPQLHHLATWAKGEALWQTATMSSEETLEQSCKVAEVGALLVDVLWRMLRADLPQLLHAFAISNEIPQHAPGMKPLPALIIAPETMEPEGADILSVVADVPERLRLQDYAVVGHYARYSHVVRHMLRDVCSRIELACRAKTSARQNFLLWGRPGTGKTYLVTELGDSLKPDVSLIEINLSACDEVSFEAGIKTIEASPEGRIAFVDEIDAHSGVSWPFETIMPRLDINTKGCKGIVWILAGSSANAIEEFIAQQKQRTKGVDVFDRIPASNLIAIPPQDHGDRLLAAISQVLKAAKDLDKVLTAVERFALFYVLSSTGLATLRQVSEAVVRACDRVPLGQKSLKYDHFFDPGDNHNKEFWAANRTAADTLAGQYIEIGE